MTSTFARMSPGGATSDRKTRDIHFPRPIEAVVSIVIPVHNHIDDTLLCLRALEHNTPPGSFEVIVCDDASSDATSQILPTIEGLKVVRLDVNVGFLGAITAAIAVATGRYLLMLNNDTEVQPGWLTALLDVAECDPMVGAVGSKLLFPDGRLQEAGSMVWKDGSAWNRGYGRDSSDPAFNYRLEVDYCSAASLLVRRSAYDAVGGFDRRFMPAYYEDADLCFSLRAAGYSVVYQPESVVIHQGSASHPEGTATATPGVHTKRVMDVNRHIFSGKWATELDRHWPNGTAMGYRGGRIDHRPRVLVVDSEVPAHDRDAGGLRMASIIELLVDLGCAVTLFPSFGRRREPYATRFQRLGVEVQYSPWTMASLVGERAGLYDLVLLSRPDVGAAHLSTVQAGFPAARIVYDTVDLHYLREQRRLAVTGETPGEAWNTLRRTELRLIRSSDIVATVSSDEACRVRGLVPGTDVVILPTVHDVPAAPPPPFEGRRGMVFIGGFMHDPNVDAMTWFVSEIMPRIGEGTSPLVILGSHPTSEVTALASDSVVVTGYVPDVQRFFRSAAVFVAPLRYGAGMKGKVGQAMSLGLPVVTTAIGAEGFGIVDGVHALVRDDPKSFAAAVADVSSDRDLWAHLSKGGLNLVRSTLSRACMRERLRVLLADTLASRCQ